MSAPRSILVAATLCAGLLAKAQLGVINAEYFWDIDPGVGNGTAMTAADGSFGAALETALANSSSLPATGMHTFNVRVKDEDNAWGTVFSIAVEIWDASTPVQDISVQTAEYFWDVDPGQGSGTTMIAFDGNFDGALESIALNTGVLPASGTHSMGIRACDVNGDWGPVFTVVIDVWDGTTSFPDIHVQAAEYYLDTDPGAGIGTPMLAADGNFDTAVEYLVGGGIPVPVTSGVHVLYLRAQDIVGDWGPSFGIVVNIDTTITGTVAVNEAPLDEHGFGLYPNPADGSHSLIIDLGTVEQDVVLLLTDADGRLARELHLPNAARIDLPLAGLASGVYTLRVEADGRSEKRKVVVR